MKRFGFAIRVGGDPEIAGALAEGIEKGTGSPTGADAPPPRCGREALEAQALDAVRRVDMMRHTPEEWEELIEDARVVHGGRHRLPRWADRLLGLYGLLCYGVSLGWRRLMAEIEGGGTA